MDIKEIAKKLEQAARNDFVSHRIRNLPLKTLKKWKRVCDWLGYSKADEGLLFSKVVNLLDEVVYLSDKTDIMIDKENINIIFNALKEHLRNIFNEIKITTQEIKPEEVKVSDNIS